MLMLNPHTGKLVDVAPAFVDQLSGAGFKKQESEAVEPHKLTPARKSRTRKTTD